ncbi:MAG TPA: S9 family peptidase [Egibacteraceae bacterium]|nr:S9 family peptidase [Egibacteraceae bacterium]
MGDIRRYLQIRSSGQPAYTADGRRLLLTGDLTGLPQAWTVPAGGGWPVQLSGGGERVRWVAASPVDAGVAVAGRDVGGDERTQLWLLSADGAVEQPLTAEPRTIHRFGDFTPDGDGLVFAANDRNGVDFDLYRRDLDGGSAHLVTTLSGSQHPGAVAPDGSAVVVVHARSLMESDLQVVDLRTGAVRLLAAGGRHRPGGFDDEGRRLYLAADHGRDHLAAWRVDLATGAWERFGPADRDIEEVAVRAGAGVLRVNDDGRSRLHRFDPTSLEVGDETALPTGVVSDLALAPDGRRVAFAFSGAVHPGAVWEVEVGAVDARPTTPASTPGLDPAAFVAPEIAHATSFDGLSVPLLVYRPHGGAGRGPAVISVHGGPESQERPGFNPVHQYLLAEGVAVVAPNVRGSTGYGRRYAGLDDRGRRLDAVADLDAVAGWAGEQGFDPLAIMGGSYGGYMTLSALTAFPARFAAGVSIVGMADLETFLENTGGYRRALREAEYGSLDADRDLLSALSPIHRVDRINAPLLVIHGANDPRVPISEAEQIVEALRARQRPVEYLRFDDEGHGIARFDNRVTAYTAVAEFLVRHLL